MKFREALEVPTVETLLGDLSDGTENVADLACGEGIYTRLIRSKTR